MKVISYPQLVMNEGGIQVQKGMNFAIKKSYSIVLMSTEKNAPYNDSMLEDGVIEYEGHDAPRNDSYNKKEVDQPIANKTGTLTENGKFMQAADNFKEGKREPALIKVYRKIRKGVWVDMGFYDLIDGFNKFDGKRNVFKFLLKPNTNEIDRYSTFLKEHISIVNPKILILMGSTAMEAVTGLNQKISNERGEWKEVILKNTT